MIADKQYSIAYIDRTTLIHDIPQIAFMVILAPSFIKAYWTVMSNSYISDKDILSIKSKPPNQPLP